MIKWNCLACSGPPMNPQIVRRNKWIVATTCASCGTINHHSKYGDFIFKTDVGSLRPMMGAR